MLYVSFVEIFVKSLDGFADSSAFGDSDACLMATGTGAWASCPASTRVALART